MKKVRSLSNEKIDEISALIGASFWDYPYESDEGGLKPFFSSKQAMTEYMKSFVIAGVESVTFYCTDHDEGYILITDTKGNHPNLRSTGAFAVPRRPSEKCGRIYDFCGYAYEAGRASAPSAYGIFHRGQ